MSDLIPEVVTWPCCGVPGATLRTADSRRVEIRSDTCECGQHCVFMFSSAGTRAYTREQFAEKFVIMGDTVMLREHAPKPWPVAMLVRKLLRI